MIGYHEALRHILAACERLPAETVPVAHALGRVLAQDVVADADLPPFDNSAMDGFALATGGRELEPGLEFTIIGSQAAGDAAMNSGAQACEIMTGASVPDGLDAVLPIEQACVLARDADGRPQRIRLEAGLVSGANIRTRGEDVARGQAVLRAGSPITPTSRMLLAALGVPEVLVSRQVPVSLLATGRELVDDPRQPLASGQIRNSNRPYLADRLRETGACLVHRGTLGDEIGAFTDALALGLAAGARVIVSTGAVSMGRHDFIPDALRALGADIVFHKVAIRPGKPLLFARLPNGQLYFGLPGNPVSAAVGMRFFVEPALRALLGQPPERPLRLPLMQSVRKKPGLRYFQNAQLLLDAQATLRVRLLPGQQSFRIQPMLEANAWAVLDERTEQLAAGSLVDVYGLQGRGVLLSLLEESDAD